MVAELAVGEEFAGHRIEALLGRGGMGVVYLAEHLRLGRKVAIKLVNPELASDDAFRRRFLRESQAAAALEHPNIVPIYDAGESEGLAYISMRYVDGMDLSALLKSQGLLSPATAIVIAYQVAMALDAAHEHGLIHRDVKPANILLERLGDRGAQPRAFLSDFGITKRLAGEQTTETGQFLGTIDYTAPEQITGSAVQPATDQYSLACVLYQCLIGTVPFPRANELAVMYAHLEEPPPSLRHSGLEAHVDPVIQRGMAKAPARRFRSCSEMVGSAAVELGIDLRPGAGSGDPLGSAAGVSRPLGRTTVPIHRGGGGGSRHARRGRTRWPVAVAVAVLAVAGAVGAFIATRGHVLPGAAGSPTTPASGRATAPVSDHSPRPPRSASPFPSGFSWQRVSSAPLGGPGRQAINRAAVGGSSIVAVGYQDPPGIGNLDPAVWRSSDGLHWSRTEKTEPGVQGMDAVAFDGKKFVAVGTQNGHEARAWIIPADGSSWESVAETGISGGAAIHKVVSTPAGLVAAGWAPGPTDQDATVWRSADGRAWTRETADGFVGPEGSNQEMWGIAAFDGGLVAAGSDDRAGDQDAAFWRFDDRGWREPIVVRQPGQQMVRAVVAGGPGLVAVGSTVTGDSTDAAIWISRDGLRWKPVPGLAAPRSQQLTGVLPFRGGLVAVGAEGPRDRVDVAVWTSIDGMTWSRITSDVLGGRGAQFAHGVVAFRGRLVVVGDEDMGGGGQAAVWIGTPITSPAIPSARPGATGAPTSGPSST